MINLGIKPADFVTMYKISCIHPTCRTKLAIETRKKWLELAENPEIIQYITCFDSLNKEELNKRKNIDNNLIDIFEPYSFGIVKKCNIAARYAKANCIIVATDDTIPEKGWDTKILNTADWSQEIVLNVSDGTEEKDTRVYMVKTVILSLKRYKKLGYVLHPEFDHVYCDNFHSWISHRDGVVLNRKNIMFEHLHPSMGKSKVDDIYIKCNTQSQYDRGEKIFQKLARKLLSKQKLDSFITEFTIEVDPIKKFILAFLILSHDTKFEKKLTEIARKT